MALQEDQGVSANFSMRLK